MSDATLTVFDGRYNPLTNSLGLVRAPMAEFCAANLLWKRSLGFDVREDGRECSLNELLAELSLPAEDGRVFLREAFIEADLGWAAYFNDSMGGPDQFAVVGHLAMKHGWDAVIACIVPDEGYRGHLAARRLALYRRNDQDHRGGKVRDIAVSFDDRKWYFDSSGVPLPFENTFSYAAKRIRDRLTPAMVIEYCHHLGVRPFDETFYKRQARLLSYLPVARE